jgi:hypothetical protein
MVFAVVWIVFSFVIGSMAGKRGRSPALYFLISMLLSPVIGLLVLLVQGPNAEKIEAEKLESGELCQCPFCAELVKAEAKICRFCGKELPIEEA